MRKAKFNRPLTIAFNSQMYQKIKQKSDEHEISMASWVRQAIDKILSTEKEKPTEKAEPAESVGKEMLWE